MGARAFCLHFAIFALLLILSIPFSQELQSQMQLYPQKTTVNVWLLKYNPGQIATIDPETSLEEEKTGPNLPAPSRIEFPNFSPLEGKTIKFYIYNPLSARPDKFDPLDSCNSAPTTDSRGMTSCDAKAELDQIKGCTNVRAAFEGDAEAPETQAVALVCPTVSWSLGAFGTAMQNALSDSQNRAFCIPVFLILGLLLSSMYYSGKNPLSLFDITTPRLPQPKKGRIAKTVLRSNLLSKLVMDRQILSGLNTATALAIGSGALSGEVSEQDRKRIKNSNFPPALKGAAMLALLSKNRELFQEIMNRGKKFYDDLRSKDPGLKAAAENWFNELFRSIDANSRNLLPNWGKELRGLFNALSFNSRNAILQEQQIRDMEETYGYDTWYSRKLLRPLHTGTAALDRALSYPLDKGYNKLFGLTPTGQLNKDNPIGMVNLVGKALSPFRFVARNAVQFARSPLMAVPILMDVAAQARMARKTGWNVMKGAGKAGLKMMGVASFRNSIESLPLGRLEDPRARMDKMAKDLSRAVKEDLLIYYMNKIRESAAFSSMSEHERAAEWKGISGKLRELVASGDYRGALDYLHVIAQKNGAQLSDRQFGELARILNEVRSEDRRLESRQNQNILSASQEYLLRVHGLIRKFEAGNAWRNPNGTVEKVIFVTSPLYQNYDEIKDGRRAQEIVRNGISYLAGVEFFYEMRQHESGRRKNAPNFYDVRVEVLKSIASLAEASARYAGVRATSLLSFVDAQERVAKMEKEMVARGIPREARQAQIDRQLMQMGATPMSEEFRRYFANKLEWWITNRNQNIYRHFSQNVNESSQILSFYERTMLPLMKGERPFANDSDAYDAMIKRGVTWGMANTLKWNPGDTERIGQEGSYNETVGKGYKGEIRGWIGTSDRTYRPLFFMEKYPEKPIPNEGPQFFRSVTHDPQTGRITGVGEPLRVFGRSVADKPVQVFTEGGQDALRTGIFRPFFQRLQTPIADFGIAAIHPNQQKIEKIFAMQALQRKVFSDFSLDYALGAFSGIQDPKLSRQFEKIAGLYGNAIFPINESSFMRDPRSASSSYGIQQAIDTGYHSGQSIYEPRAYVLSQGFTIGEDFYRSALTIPLILGRRLSYFTRASTVFAFGYPSIYNEGMGQGRPYNEASFDRPRLGRAVTSIFANFRGSDMLGGMPLIVKKEGEWRRSNLQDELRVAPRWRAVIEQDSVLRGEAATANDFMRGATGEDIVAFREFGPGESQFRPLRRSDRLVRGGQHVDLMITGKDISTGPEKYRTPEFYDAYYQNVMKPFPVGMMNIDFPELELLREKSWQARIKSYNTGIDVRQHLNPRQASQILADHSYLEGMFPGIRDDASQNIWRRDLAPVDGYAIDPVKGTQIAGLIAERKQEYGMYEFGILPPYHISRLYTGIVGEMPAGQEKFGTKTYLEAKRAAEGLPEHERRAYEINAYYHAFNPYTAWLIPPLKLSHTLERKGMQLYLWGASKARGRRRP